ncbi:MAG: hypothetical protein ACREMA_11865 [Longimicrobiales bacterium]
MWESRKGRGARRIKEAVLAGEIKPYDPDQGKKTARYLPWWA